MLSIFLVSLALATEPVAVPPPLPDRRRRVFLSPMGEPFRSGPDVGDPMQLWFDQADANRDGALSAVEVRKDGDRFFATLDTDHDGEIAPVELNRYETEVAPEIQVGPRSAAERRAAWGGDRVPGPGEARPNPEGRGEGGERGPQGRGIRVPDNGLQGAGRFSLLNIPEPVAAADADLNRGVSLPEFERAAGARFLMLDTNRDGKLTFAELQAIQQANEPELPKGKGKKRPRRRTEGQALLEEGSSEPN